MATNIWTDEACDRVFTTGTYTGKAQQVYWSKIADGVWTGKEPYVDTLDPVERVIHEEVQRLNSLRGLS